jgi:hypothetical protein
MTNKDKFIEVFGFEPDTETMIPVCPPRGVECPFMDDGIYSECHCELWWGREYKAPDNRKCEACKHHVIMVEVGDGKPLRHTSGCELWECKFEPKEPIIDKIRAEILEEHENAYAREDYDTAYGLSVALDIIDKYKAESEKA